MIISFWTNCTWLTQNEIKNKIISFCIDIGNAKWNKKNQNEIIITLFQNVLQQGWSEALLVAHYTIID